jgi:hypothetical protein
MSGLTDLEAVADALPVEDKRELVRFLLSRLHREGVDTADLHVTSQSILDIKPVSLGAVLKPLGSEDDLLGEMSEDHQ